MINKIRATFFGLAIGDALGVPVEFRSREHLQRFPITGMTGNGSWNQPLGTWSDDSSLAFCLAESLTKCYELNDIAQNFINWKQHGYWGAHHRVFDIGGATRFAIDRLTKGCSPFLSGGMMEEDNGNGALMRIMPLLFIIKDLPISERYKKIKEVSAVTHAHFRSVFSCFIYLEFALQILNGNSMDVAYMSMQQLVKSFAEEHQFNPKELELFNRVLSVNIKDEEEKKIYSSGYVLHTLEASLWCLLNTRNYADAVLKAVNLGGDTDTTGCVTGGLAGLLYGYDDIPKGWIRKIARGDDIGNLCTKLTRQIENKNGTTT
jgi:ADP-ribosyl-[dinitrogen reductase] hydrolase